MRPEFKVAARYVYSHVPFVAAARFAVKDLTAPYFTKPEYGGVSMLDVGTGLVVDIGANRGQSIAAFKRLAPACRIVAFEPEPISVGRLVRRYERDPKVIIQHCALGKSTAAITFYVPHYGRWNCDGMSATSYEEATQWLRDPRRMFAFDEKKLRVVEHRVQCRTLDSFGLVPRVIKVHAQGAELPILEGAEQTIRCHRPTLMCAFPQPEVTRLLAAWGYHPSIYHDHHFSPGIAEHPTTFTWYLPEGDPSAGID